jgi:GntR family transcriptional regulator
VEGTFDVGDEPQVPKYQAIADDFREQIASGELRPGSQLPAERLLATEQAVAIETVRRAYRTLVQDGLIEQIQGKGTFVRDWTPVVRNIGQRMKSEVWSSGQSVWAAETANREYGIDSSRVHRGVAPEYVAAVMGESEVWIRQRRHLVDKRPVMLSTSYYPASIVDGSPITQPETGPGGSPARLAELGHAPAENRELFRSRVPTLHERRLLSLPKSGSAVSDIVRTIRDAAGRVVEVTEMVASGDAYIHQFDYLS